VKKPGKLTQLHYVVIKTQLTQTYDKTDLRHAGAVTAEHGKLEMLTSCLDSCWFDEDFDKTEAQQEYNFKTPAKKCW